MVEQIGKYRIDSVLGKGAMGVVYKAFDPHIERVVALKTIRKELLQDGLEHELVARFKNEAQASGRLTHPNIVAVYDYGETPDAAFIAMEYVEGTALSALLVPDQPSEQSRVLVWMTQLLRALAYAHAKGVVHRDIKPANLIITPAGELKITDFGIARIESSTLTQTGSMVGTPSYMSPEQFRGADIDGRSDVFSAGIVLYQLLTGTRPFTGSASVVMQKILNEAPAHPSSLNLPLGSGFDAILSRALAKNPADRYDTASAFLDALLHANQDERTGAAPQHAPALSDEDRTILAGQMQNVDRARRAATLAPAQGSGFHGTAGLESASAMTMTPWKIEVMPTLEQALVRQIGPMAKLLLKKASSKAEDLETLCTLVLAHIPSATGKVEFQGVVNSLRSRLSTMPGMAAALASLSGVSALRSGTGTGMGTALASGVDQNTGIAADDTIGPDFPAAAEKILTRYIGAIAKVVVRRALAKTTSKTVLLESMAQQIDKPDERTKFLQEISRS